LSFNELKRLPAGSSHHGTPGALLAGEARDVIDKLDFLLRFWELKARHATLGEPLASREQVELLSLMQLVVGEVELPAAGPVPRPSSALPAQLIGDGTMRAVEIRGLSAAAIVVACGLPVTRGAQVIVRATDAVRGVEYALPCKVMWVHPGTAQDACTMALVVDGIPARSAFATRGEPHVTAALAMGRQERLVG
jgi:hypothetical protein